MAPKKIFTLAGLAVVLFAAQARAELRHVELKTLGMD
jgi:hypothetical protein